MRRRLLPLLALLALPAPALAGGTVVIAPFVGVNIDAKVARNVTSLVSAELDFSGEFDSVTELAKAPPTLDANCLTNTGCLAGIATANDGDAVIIGTVEPGGSGLQIALVYYDARARKIRGRESVDVEADPGTLASEAGQWVKSLLAAGAPAVAKPGPAAAAAVKPKPAPPVKKQARDEPTVNPDTFTDDEDEFAFDSPSRPTGKGKGGKATPAARGRAESEATTRADAEAKTRAVSERRPATPVASPSRAAPAAEEDSFEFGSATDLIAVEKSAAERTAAPRGAASRGDSSDAPPARTAARSAPRDDDDAPPARTAARSASRDDDDAPPARTAARSAPRDDDDAPPARTAARSAPRDDDDAPPARTAARSAPRGYDDDEAERDAAAIAEARAAARARASRDDEDDRYARPRTREDEDAPRTRVASNPRGGRDNGRATIRGAAPEVRNVGLTARAGQAFVSTMGFVTWGAEVDVKLAGGVHFLGGIEGQSTRRSYTDDQLSRLSVQKGIAPEDVPLWNTILPINAGVAWRHGGARWRPYVGADLTLVPYTADFDVAVGFRGRGGVDVMFTPAFGLNANVALGVLSGSELELTQEGFHNTNFTPAFSGGTVVRF